MAKEQSVPGYELKVSGEYFSKDVNTGQKSIKQFKAKTFELPEIVTYVEGRKSIEKIINGRSVRSTVPNIKKGNASRVGLHIIRRYYLDSILREEFPEFTGVRTCQIFSKTKIKMKPQKKFKDSEIQNMAESDLKQFIILNDVNIVLSQYGDLGDMKNAVIMAYKQKKIDDKAAGITPDMDQDALDLLPADGIQESSESASDLFA